MSLLLDALKKAAEDKKKASDNSANATNVFEKNGVSQTVADELSLEEIKNSGSVSVPAEKISNETLMLDVESGARAGSIDLKATEQDEVSRDAIGRTEARHTVSDDALSLLIYKTNSEEKKRKRIFAIGTALTALLAVGLGGVYYYLSLQENIDRLELKHRTSMMRMEAKTNKQRPPEKIEIIDNLTANSDIKVEKKVEVVVIEDDVEVMPLQKKKIRPAKKSRLAQSEARLLIIEKTKQADIVGKKLDIAWGAYEAGNYTEAKNLYHEVMQAENNNRDALLGLAAIAVIEKDVAVAKKYYRALLKLDPNDPLAIAALSSLRSNKSSPEVSEKYLVSMLEKTPDVAQLNFELGNVYAQQNNWPSAQKVYFKAWQQDNENPDYIFNLAVSLDQLGQQQQAMRFYKDSLLKAKNKQVSFSRATVEQRVTELSGL